MNAAHPIPHLAIPEAELILLAPGSSRRLVHGTADAVTFRNPPRRYSRITRLPKHSSSLATRGPSSVFLKSLASTQSHGTVASYIDSNLQVHSCRHHGRRPAPNRNSRHRMLVIGGSGASHHQSRYLAPAVKHCKLTTQQPSHEAIFYTFPV